MGLFWFCTFDISSLLLQGCVHHTALCHIKRRRWWLEIIRKIDLKWNRIQLIDPKYKFMKVIFIASYQKSTKRERMKWNFIDIGYSLRLKLSHAHRRFFSHSKGGKFGEEWRTFIQWRNIARITIRNYDNTSATTTYCY